MAVMEDETRQSRFLSLPNETIIDILCVVDPINVLNIRATCRQLHQISYHRAIWLSALGYTSWIHRVPLATYPTSVMTLAELESEATRPYRFASKLAKEEAPAPVSQLPISIQNELPHGHNLRFVQFIPGGRWIIAADGHDTFFCWDSHYPSRTSDARDGFFEVLRVQFDSVVSDARIQPSDDRNGVYVLISQETSARLYLMSFDYDDGPHYTVSFKRVTSVRTLSVPLRPILEGDYFAFQRLDEDGIVICNWREDTWGEIRHDSLQFQETQLIRIHLTYISTFDSNGVSRLFLMPHLFPHHSSSSPAESDDPYNPPILNVSPINWSEELDSTRLHYGVTSEQWRSFNYAGPCPYVTQSHDLATHILLFTPDPGLFGETMWRTPIVLGNQTRLYEMESITVSPVRMVGGADGKEGERYLMVTMWWTNGALFTHVLPISTSSNYDRLRTPSPTPSFNSDDEDPLPFPRSRMRTTALREEEGRVKPILQSSHGFEWTQDWVAHSFCNVTGRVVVSLGTGQILILDYA